MPINPISPGEYTNQYDLQQMRNNQQNANNLADFLNKKALLSQQGQQEQSLASQKANLQSTAQQKALQTIEQFMPKDKNGNPVLPQGAGLSLNGEGAALQRQPNMLSAFLGMDKFYDKQAQDIASKSQSEGIPSIQAQTDILNQDMAQHGGHLESVGGAKNMIPDSIAPLAEFLHILPKGSAKERQDIAALRNAAMHAQFGSRQTEAEKSMMANQLGTGIGNPASNIEASITGLGKVANQEGQNLLSGMNPEAVRRFKARGGELSVSPVGSQQSTTSMQQPAGPQASDPDYQRYLQLKQKAGM